MIKDWTDINLREKSKKDLEYKLGELDKVPWVDLDDEEKVLYTQIKHALDDDPNKSSSVEDTLNNLGNIVIVLGIISGLILTSYGVIENDLFIAIWGLAGILSALISGYVLKGLSRIISLLLSLQNTNSKDQ